MKPVLTLLVVSTVLFALCFVPQRSAYARADNGTVQKITGTVLYEDFPLAGATVSLDGHHEAVVTDHTGAFTLFSGSSARLTIIAERYGFQDARAMLPSSARSTRTVTIKMSPSEAVRKRAADARQNFEDHMSQKEQYLETLTVSKDAAKPNVIFILFDDLGYGDLSGYGNKLISTPALDAAADGGARFSNFYAGAPSCTPSRASFLTGRYPHRSLASNHVFYPDKHPVTLFRKALGYANALPRDEIVIAEILKGAGYRTAMIGKWHLGDIEGHMPEDFGFDSFYGVLHSNDMVPFDIYRGRTIELPERAFSQSRLTQMYTDEALRIVSEKSDRPFFLYLAHTFPHVPHHAHPEQAGKSRAGKYGDVVADLDRSVERLLGGLAEAGLTDNTLVIITSDNGAGSGGSSAPFKGRKGQILEGGMRVPMIMLWPGRIKAGLKIDSVGIGADILPTLTELVGAPLPQDRRIDGRSLWPMLNGDAGRVHDTVFYFHSRTAEPIAARRQNYKYVGVMKKTLTLASYPVAGGFQQVFRAPRLYDLANDQMETHNLIDQERGVAAELKSALEVMRSEADDNPRGWLK